MKTQNKKSDVGMTEFFKFLILIVVLVIAGYGLYSLLRGAFG